MAVRTRSSLCLIRPDGWADGLDANACAYKSVVRGDPDRHFCKVPQRESRLGAQPSAYCLTARSIVRAITSVPKPTFRIELQDDGFVFSSLPPFYPTNSFCHSVHGLLRSLRRIMVAPQSSSSYLSGQNRR
ncbi:hypothetical protein DAPPUDRAFT_232162 [Daphnia pulex]|uniref:Uncharacterized protein n=1 Tax=Daphnia pulex TaxID=6669 RepID=E9FS04_DAPPU|nr:hypothetical protein DAPPUDRAFT_232162 [Daphnia pulex]|eukprot:EFX89945.1 hypothetical protein DAPPUDRAFT_232162 [Daphnia pulex]